jgi:V/A-type H+-transporting ATPase subunit I
MGYLGGIATISGISCMVFGAVTGTFFGDIIPQMAAFFGGSVTMPALIDPLKDPMTVLIICIGIGVVHMLIGVTVNGYMLVRDGQWFDALCDAGTVYLTFAGIALGALGVTWWVAIAGVAGIVLTAGRSSASIGGKLGGGLWGLYNFATGWFGDILSYCRLMALMLAGTVIAQVFNTLGAMTGNIVAFLLIFLVGHSLNFGLNIIGTYVHTSRLEYLEFFGKFYREGGRAFQPLAIKTNYYNVSNN